MSRGAVRLAGTLLLAIAAACGSPAPSALPRQHVTTPPARPTPLPSPTPTAGASPAAPTEPRAAGPPAAELVGGGIRQPGELGSWTWAGLSDSAPWLPATALETASVDRLAALRVEVRGETPLDEWTAMAAPAADPSGTETTGLGAGRGVPAFAAPSGGDWVVAVQVRFLGGGDATYYWALRIR